MSDMADYNDGKCVSCGKKAVYDYDDREDCPSCGSYKCDLEIEMALAFAEDHDGSGR